MRFQQPNQINHTGFLLVALPTLLDPNFRRSILFLTHHDPTEGAMGFIMNRPRQESLGDLTEAPGGLSGVPVFEGGPVEPQNLILTQLLWKESGIRFQSLGVEDFLPREPQGDSDPESHHQNLGNNLRAFTGYAGWSAGQLEREITEKSWHLLKPTEAMLLPVTTQEEGVNRWKSVMKDLGPWHHLLAQAPDDLSLN